MNIFFSVMWKVKKTNKKQLKLSVTWWRTSHLSSRWWGSGASSSCPGSGSPPCRRCSCPGPGSASETGWAVGRSDTRSSFCATGWCSSSRSCEHSSGWRPAGGRQERFKSRTNVTWQKKTKKLLVQSHLPRWRAQSRWCTGARSPEPQSLV